MDVSLIVATYKRRKELDRLLRSLAEQTCMHFQVIIVDQNPCGYLDEVVGLYNDILNLKVVTTEPKGVSYARNHGLQYVTQGIVGFPDDDCWYAPQAVEEVIDFFQNRLDVTGLLVSWSDGGIRETKNDYSPVSIYNAFFRAGTLVQFYRKDLIEDVVFDLSLGPGTGLPYGCGEDTDFLLQVLQRGLLVLRSSDVIIFHREPDVSDVEPDSKIIAYAIGRMYLLKKHNFPFWFKIANVFYPFYKLFFEKPHRWRYRKVMFVARFKALLGV